MSGFEKAFPMGFVEAGEEISRDEVEAELRLVLNGPEFLKNNNSAKFLKFIVDETLEGRGSRLKAYTIATLALDRESSFDPQTNSIVRVQAMRLRELLDGYYSSAGSSDPLRIVLRRGAYQPAFERRPKCDRDAVIDGAKIRVAEERRTPFARRRLSLLVGSAAVLASIIAWSLWTRFVPGFPSVRPTETSVPFDAPPSVFIRAPEMLGASLQTARLSGRLFGLIEEGMSKFHYISLQSSDFMARSSAGRSYVLNGQVMDSGNGRADIALRLLRQPTGDVIWFHHYDKVDAYDLDGVDRLAKSIVTDLGDAASGALFADIREQLMLANAPLRGYYCLIEGVEFLRTRTPEQSAPERKCLESALVANPDDVGALTLLSSVLVLGYLDSAAESLGAADLQRAAQLASRASDLAPQRASTLEALFYSRFYDKRFDDAFLAARHALATNPNSGVLVEPIASAYISRGFYAEGLALLEPLEAAGSTLPVAAIPFLALARRMNGEASAAFNYTQRVGARSTPLGLVMRLIACNERGDAGCVGETSGQLSVKFPGFARNVPAALDRYAFTDIIKADLLKGLAAAGYLTTAPDR